MYANKIAQQQQQQQQLMQTYQQQQHQQQILLMQGGGGPLSHHPGMPSNKRSNVQQHNGHATTKKHATFAHVTQGGTFPQNQIGGGDMLHMGVGAESSSTGGGGSAVPPPLPPPPVFSMGGETTTTMEPSQLTAPEGENAAAASEMGVGGDGTGGGFSVGEMVIPALGVGVDFGVPSAVAVVDGTEAASDFSGGAGPVGAPADATSEGPSPAAQ